MTTIQLLLMDSFYLAVLVAVTYCTRARMRRILGALAGGAAFGVIGVLAVVLGEAQGWWRVPQSKVAYFHFHLWLGFAISCAPVYLIVWRVVRRFGGRGLIVCVLAATIIGPPRDYWITAMFPDWMTFAPGITPIIADAGVYALLILVGYGVMRSVSGTAQGDSLART